MEYDDYYAEYIGKHVKKDFVRIAQPILEKGRAQFNSIDRYEINVILLKRDFDEDGETFSLSCYLIIKLKKGVITEIYPDTRVWGGDGLGDVNPGEICTSEELKRMGQTETELLKAITE